MTIRFLLFFVFIQFTQLTAQELPKRPKVGLVLSGGAAHGLAHIGVIKYLEEIGIEVDYVTGTSMGSIIGGLYAMGLSADEMYDVVKSQDWDHIIGNKIPLDEVSAIEKEYHQKLPLNFVWEDKKLQLPKSILSSQKLDLCLSRMFSSAHHIDHFDNLYRPFRCVAIDIEDGDIKVFEDGKIHDAIRASMAIPSVFAPKEIDDRLYVDGGLIRNFPVIECKDMGADILIGVFTGSRVKPKEKLKSWFGIMGQATIISSFIDLKKQKELTDIYIDAVIEDLDRFEFDRYEDIIDGGYDAALENEESLLNLAEYLSSFESIKFKNEKLIIKDEIELDKVNIKSEEPSLKAIVRKSLSLENDSDISFDELDYRVNRLFGTKNFTKIDYELTSDDSQKLSLNIDSESAKNWGVGLSINRFNNYNTSFIVTAQFRNLLLQPSVLHIQSRLSEYSGLSADYFLRSSPLSNLVFSIHAKAEQYLQPFMIEGKVERVYQRDERYIGGQLNYEFSNSMLVSSGYRYRYDNITPEVLKEFDVVRYRSLRNELYFKWQFNNTDHHYFATKGFDLSFSYNYQFGQSIDKVERVEFIPIFDFNEDKSFRSYIISGKYYLSHSDSWCSKFGIMYRNTYWWRPDETFQNAFYNQFRLGGPQESKDDSFGLSGLDESELIYASLLYIGCNTRVKLLPNLYVEPDIYFLFGEDLLHNVYGSSNFIYSFGGGVSLSYDSPLGPISLNIGRNSRRNGAVANVGVGYRFIK